MTRTIAVMLALVAVSAVAAEPEQPPPDVQFLAPGTRVAEPELGLSFAVPTRARLIRERRGNFPTIEVTALSDDDYFVAQTAFQIRLEFEKELPQMIANFVPGCTLPPLPQDGGDFDIDTECAGTVGENQVVRYVRIVRRELVLHFLYVAFRKDRRDQGDAIVKSVKLVSRQDPAP